ncbi:hypothetical protein EJB05_49484, partial [Eragrostis curvula]
MPARMPARLRSHLLPAARIHRSPPPRATSSPSYWVVAGFVDSAFCFLARFFHNIQSTSESRIDYSNSSKL